MKIDATTYQKLPEHLKALFQQAPNPSREEVLAGFPVTGPSSGAQRVNRASKSIGTFGTSDRVTAGVADAGGSAARFFQQCKGAYNELWQDLNLPQENVNTAEQSSSLQRQSAVSALVHAVNLALPEGLLCKSLLMAPSTTATGIELKQIAEIVTQTIQSIDSRFWHESKPARLTLSLNHASDAEIQRLTDTTTITVSRWKSDGSVEPVTFSITQRNSEAGEKDCAPSMDGKRFMYCAKASKRDRDEGLEHMEAVRRPNGNKWTDQDYRVLNGERSEGRESGPRKNTHPTVKPADLMAYLCRLVTPPGGTVLDPFMGSGSTGKAAVREGFRFVGIEREAQYMDIARARIYGAVPAACDLFSASNKPSREAA